MTREYMADMKKWAVRLALGAYKSDLVSGGGSVAFKQV